MVRKRGGAAGQGGAKRTATSPPVGATYKDSRRNIQGDEDFDDEDVVIHNKQKSAEQSVVEKLNQATVEKIAINQQSRKSKSGSVIDMLNERASVRGSVAGSVKGATTTGENGKRKDSLGVDSLYKTPAPDGCMRDVFTVEVETKDRENYRGTVTYDEAKYKIFLEALEMPEELLHGIKIQFGEGPTISYKLTEQIDVDSLAGYEYFEIERKIESGKNTRSEWLGCRIKGIRARKKVMDQIDEEEESDSNLFVVTLSGCDYSVEEEEMREWLSLYGEVFGSITENMHSDEKTNAKPTGNGTYSAKMRLDANIPQFLPMYGKKVRVDHKGQQIMCTNCYGKHPRKVCKSERLEWMDYVVHFMKNNRDVSNSMIGRWFEIAKKERRVPKDTNQRSERQGPKNNYIEPNHQPTEHQTANKKIEENIPARKVPEHPQKHYQTKSQPTINKTQTFRKVPQDKMDLIIALRADSENPARMTRLHELIDLGLSLEAAREMCDNEEEIQNVNNLLKEKKKKESQANTSNGLPVTDGNKDRSFEW